MVEENCLNSVDHPNYFPCCSLQLWSWSRKMQKNGRRTCYTYSDNSRAALQRTRDIPGSQNVDPSARYIASARYIYLTSQNHCFHPETGFFLNAYKNTVFNAHIVLDYQVSHHNHIEVRLLLLRGLKFRIIRSINN